MERCVAVNNYFWSSAKVNISPQSLQALFFIFFEGKKGKPLALPAEIEKLP
jgi:hypothetical protein